MGWGALLLAAAVAAPAARGQHPWNPGRAAAAAVPGLFVAADAGTFSDGGGIPRDRLIEMVQRRFNARVVRVNLVESGGRRVYEMRLMSDQRVWNVRVDADTGQVLDGG
ncbi:MAG: PepSY domain-containing protein [Steroidobacteraceae bacterium]